MPPAGSSHFTRSANAYVQSLLDTIKQHEEHSDGRPRTHPPQSSPSASLQTSPAQGLTSVEGAAPENIAHSIHGDFSLSPATELAPGPAFESRVRSIMREHVGHYWGSGSSTDASSLVVDSIAESGSGSRWRNTTELVNDTAQPVFLSKTESHRLFDVFVSLMGINQHFLDPRSFADSIDLLYTNEAVRNAQMQTMWFTHYLLVMAMGMLIGSPSDNLETPPGSAYFAEAMRRLPPSHELGAHGITSVEILCLASLYLQWTDRKHDAYLYIGIAVRLAVALGCALPRDEQEGLSSEKCHRNRVWWTTYMLDRRLSAGLGLPMGVDERQIRADLPKPAAGFQPPLPLIINIQIARATGEIMTTFYGNTSISQAELVRRIQNLLQSLHETGRSIPANFVSEFESSHGNVSRTNASLYLMLFQAIILCIRPVILQCVKEKVQATKENRQPTPISPVISRLCSSCREAASKSIRILSKLREDRSIALFGYFDLDATFSAAFILAMMGLVENNEESRPPEGLSQSAMILKYLGKAGNKAAERRLNELRQFCLHVWSPEKLSGEWKWLREEKATRPSVSNPVGDPGSASDTTPSNPNNNSDPAAGTSLGPGMWTTWNQMTPTGESDGALLNFDQFDDFQIDLSHEMGDIYSSFNDPALPLTGIDEVDWAEVGKMFHLRD
ncbi:unnamed protein product [Clonostachys rosea f. rosea IK726]|uniref:Uncharacterized protein n=1 Tax=Clonostachys rosea f. rosea IK726 TaxID=1349383 RepID=A0ACA9TH85_BIOOC|nr:unnamed protein product [Clonostachys rosea f. rosea IK726]